MGISDGRGKISRTRAKNFIHPQAQARFDEATAQIQSQQLNALGVDAHRVLYFSRTDSAHQCTCRGAQPMVVRDEIVAPTQGPERDSMGREIQLDWRENPFGTPGETLTRGNDPGQVVDAFDDTDFEEDGEELLITPTGLLTSPAIDSSPNCGICYKSGSVPGYTLYGHQRQVFTSYDVDESYGFLQDQRSFPNKFVQVDPDGYVQFALTIPRYFNLAFISVRDNEVFGDDVVYYAGKPLTTNVLRQFSGKTIPVQVRQTFTHLVVTFDLGTEVKANIAQLSKSTDWTMFDTIGNLNVALPVTIPEVQNGDVIYVPNFRRAFKISDTPFMRTANGVSLDWQANVRVLQPQELLATIANATKLY